uniref:Synaptotagmin 1 n=1 Tax=Hirondellea gigas TaxID=1518452 RepID=A0A2P2ID37_9CRUS
MSFYDVAESMHMSSVGLLSIIIAIGVLVLMLCICYLTKCCKRCRKHKSRKKKKGPDTKSVQLLGEAYKEKADMDERADQSEDTADGKSMGKTDGDKFLGKILYKLDYEYSTNSLHVTILKCENLVALDVGGKSDPYVRIYLLPDKKKKNETKVHKKTLNPVFNETFTYKLSYEDIMSKTLMMCVYDYDRLSKHDIIGQIKITLCLVDLGKTIEVWKDLEKAEIGKQLGDICFSIRYVPTTGKLSVVILEAKNLKKMDVGGASDPYVKVCLFQGGRRLKKKKTTVKRSTLNPYYNESMSFEMPYDAIEKTNLQVTVVDYDRIGHSDVIGTVVLGVNAKGGELRHWAEMVAAPRRPIAHWHKLKDPDEANLTLTAPPAPR